MSKYNEQHATTMLNALIGTDTLAEHDKQIRDKVIEDIIRWMLISRPDTVTDYKCSDGIVRNRPLYDCATICEKLEQMKEEQKMGSPLLCAFKKGTTEYNIASDCYEQGYQQGRADRDKELAEHNVFCSNRPIEDLVLDAIAEDRERIVKKLEELEREVEYMNQFDSGFNSAINKAIKIARGGENE